MEEFGRTANVTEAEDLFYKDGVYRNTQEMRSGNRTEFETHHRYRSEGES